MPVVTSKFCINPLEGGNPPFEAMLNISFSSLDERDALAQKIYDDPNYKDYLNSVHKAESIPSLSLTVLVKRKNNIAFIPEYNINKLLKYLQSKDEFDFLKKSDRTGSFYVYRTLEYNFFKGFFTITFLSGIVSSSYTILTGIKFFLQMSLLHTFRNLFKMQALEGYEGKANRALDTFSPQEINGFKIGVESAKTWTAYFNSYLERDAYSSVYYAGFAAEECGEKTQLIRKIVSKV